MLPEPFDLEYVQRGALAIAALAVAAGLIGTWVVARGLAFFAHAVGTAAFPGLVVADGLGFAAGLGAAGAALLAAALVAALSRRTARDGDTGPAVALVLVAALAAGVVLAGDVFGSQARVDQLLFGSLLTIGGGDIALAAGVALAAACAAPVLGPRWLASGFDAATSPPGRWTDAALLMLVALVAIASLAAVGALLAAALLVVPAATTRLFFDRVAPWQAATVALALAEGLAGLWLSVELNAPPGPAIAVLAGAVLLLAALWHAARVTRPALAAAALALLVAGCGSGGDDGGGERLRVLATTPVVADLARGALGPDAQVDQLLQPGSDPHDYEPRPDDVRAAAQADLILTSGLGLDGFAAEVADSAGGDARLVAVSSVIPVKRQEGGETDPHWWHDPRNAVAAVAMIAGEAGRESPTARAQINSRAAAYSARIERTDAAIARCLEAVPQAQRVLVTDHDALGYFADRYGIEVAGAVIPALTTAAEPSAADLSRLAATIERTRVRTIFPAASGSGALVDALARRTGVRAGRELYADTLGPGGSPGATYLGALAQNAAAMAEGFTGSTKACPTP